MPAPQVCCVLPHAGATRNNCSLSTLLSSTHFCRLLTLAASHKRAASQAAARSSQARGLVAAAAQPPGGFDLSALGLEVPDIDASDIATYQQELGAEFDVSAGDRQGNVVGVGQGGGA
jgi:hypothetical protein